MTITGTRQIYSDINVQLSGPQRIFAGVVIRVISSEKVFTNSLLLQKEALVLALSRIEKELAR